MIRRIFSACMLIATLLLALPASAASSSKSQDHAVSLGPRSGLGARLAPAPIPDPLPTGGNPGDDDTPNRDGTGPSPPTRDTVGSEGRNLWSMRDLAAWIRQHAVNIARVKR
jgi:hypothetical protein